MNGAVHLRRLIAGKLYTICGCTLVTDRLDSSCRLDLVCPRTLTACIYLLGKQSDKTGCHMRVYSLATVEENREFHHFQLYPSLILLLRDTNLLNEKIGDHCGLYLILKCVRESIGTHRPGHPSLSQSYTLDITRGTDFQPVWSRHSL